MKKEFLTLLIGTLLFNFSANAQTLADYRETQADISLIYDSNWAPIGKFSIKNISNKTIVGVEIVIYCGDDKWRDPNDIFRNEKTFVCRTDTNIRPNERKILTFYPRCGDETPKSFSLSRIRYEDGTICNK